MTVHIADLSTWLSKDNHALTANIIIPLLTTIIAFQIVYWFFETVDTTILLWF